MKFKVNGLAKVLRDIDKFEADSINAIDLRLKKIADEILADAVSRVHVVSGDLKNSAFIEKIDDGYVIGFSISYAPYEEFGTGGLVNAPDDYKAYALTFKVQGGKTRNGEPHPFLFPAFLARREGIVKELEDSIRKFVDRFNKKASG